MKVKFPIVLLLITTRPIGVTCLKAMNKTHARHLAILIQKKTNRKFCKLDKNDEAPCTSYVRIDSIPCYN